MTRIKIAYYTVKEFAKQVQLHPNTIRKAIADGRINAFRITSGLRASFRIPMNEINRIAFMYRYKPRNIKEK